jgi:Auxin responsive protein
MGLLYSHNITNPNRKENPSRISFEQRTMIHPKKVIGMAKKWERIATFRRRTSTDACSYNTPVVNKGHFVVYTVDKKRFEVPLDYLNSRIFLELLRISEEEFGLSNDGPIILPCEASLMKYAMNLIRWKVSKEVEKELLDLIVSKRCQSRWAEVNLRQQTNVY